MRLPRAALARVPEGHAIVRVERMSRAFTKYHLDDGRALHRFGVAEPHATPHDHPWPFETTILDGGYVDEVFHLHAGGGWHSERVHRVPGATYRIEATHIHRIVELPTGECWTLVRAGRSERGTRFWRFGDTVQSRAWHARKWIAATDRQVGAANEPSGRAVRPVPVRADSSGEETAMTEATWGEATKTPDIDWRMSAAIENVPRGDDDVAEVTSLEGAVRAWLTLDPAHRAAATLTAERGVQIDGASTTTFTGDGIARLAEHLPQTSSG